VGCSREHRDGDIDLDGKWARLSRKITEEGARGRVSLSGLGAMVS
jgi:hypothetical protein